MTSNRATDARLTRRQWLEQSVHVTGLGAITSAIGCGNRQRVLERDSLTILYPADETALGPDEDFPAQFMVFLPLVVWNSQGEMEGRLAESWEHTPDYRTWTVRLREGIRWHDGVPVTAEDVKFSWDLRSHPDVLWFTPGSYTVTVLDPLTYTIRYHKSMDVGMASGVGVMDSWTVCYPKHKLEKLKLQEFRTWDFWKQPVGNGPYRYVRHVPKTMMEFERNPDYYRGTPRIAKVTLKFADTTGTGSVTELLSGTVDASAYVKREDVLKTSLDPRFVAYDELNYDYITVLFWNHRHPLFRDAKVRKALTHAIDRRELLQLLSYPSNTPVLDAPVSRSQAQRREFAPPFDYNPEIANRLLDEAGWSARSGRGIRERDGRAFAFSLIRFAGPQSGQNDAIVYIQSQLKRIGVRMDIDQLEGESVSARVMSGGYEAALHNFWFKRAIGPGGFLGAAGYASPKFLELDRDIQAVTQPSEEDRLYRELTGLFQEDVPATFLFPPVNTTIASRRIRGLDDSPYRGDLTRCMDDLSLEGAS